MDKKRDWTESLGLVLYVDDGAGQFWVKLVQPPKKNVALIPENREVLKRYVERFSGKPVERLDAPATVFWAIMENLLR